MTSLPLIAGVALLLRAGFTWDYRSQLPRRALSVIPFLFESGNIAHALAVGEGFSSPFRVPTGPTAWLTPLYPLLLSGIMRVFGSYTFASWVAAVSVNICFSMLVCVPLFYAGRLLGGVRLGAAAAWFWALFPNAILLSFESMWDTSLSALLGATLLWATLRVAESPRVRNWLGYGLLWGITLMTNAVFLSLVPFLLGWLAYLRRHVRLPALAAGVIALCCVPWTIRNYAVFHSLIPLRTPLGLQLWIGNNASSKVIWLGEQHPINDRAEREHYEAVGEVAYMREKLELAEDYIWHHPGREAGLIGGRFVSLWAGGTPTPVNDFFRNHSAWFRFKLLCNLGVALGSVVGIVLLFRGRHPYAIPLAVYPVVFPWAYYLTLALPRYRHPIDPVLMLLTAVGVAGASRRPGAERPPVGSA